MLPNVRAAHEAGVTILAGTDNFPCGTVSSEIEWLVRAGPPSAATLGAASWSARSYLGLPGLVDGAPADLVAYDTDPALDASALAHPSRTIPPRPGHSLKVKRQSTTLDNDSPAAMPHASSTTATLTARNRVTPVVMPERTPPYQPSLPNAFSTAVALAGHPARCHAHRRQPARCHPAPAFVGRGPIHPRYAGTRPPQASATVRGPGLRLRQVPPPATEARDRPLRCRPRLRAAQGPFDGRARLHLAPPVQTTSHLLRATRRPPSRHARTRLRNHLPQTASEGSRRAAVGS